MSFVFWIVVAVLALWVITTYNALISLKNRVANAWKQIDVQLKR
ncbi:MAG TPA: LemA family protein, partial [Methylomirabilota bacterium]|nr:LemA family protein [Methylomirabilota bacterium]